MVNPVSMATIGWYRQRRVNDQRTPVENDHARGEPPFTLLTLIAGVIVKRILGKIKKWCFLD
jgi:hypothetical protein